MLREHVRHVILSYNCPKAVGTWSLVKFTFRLTFAHPAFIHLTHLHIHSSNMPWIQSDYSWSSLTYPPCLTHLSFAENCVGEHGCRAALQRCTSLEVLVWLLRDRRYTPWSRYNSYNTPSLSVRHITDPRFVQLPMPDYRADRERGARVFHDYWVEAEAIVAERYANIA
ncbi:hypothetical protein FB451DRAFT_1437195 [Mycena latifolia]|nr:hypothetical protein FB451DRAFT_1437195 [Mycena latifolia]